MPRKTKQLAQPEKTEVRIVFNEAGSSGLKEAGGFVQEAYHPQLYYPQCYPVFHKIRTSMPTMVMVGRTYSAWSKNITIKIDLPDNPTDDDKRYQEFRYQDVENMEGGFTRYLETAVTRVLFEGFGIWEKVYSIRDPQWIPPPYIDASGQAWADKWRSEYDDGLIGLRRLAWRDTSSFMGWKFDGAKRAIGFTQQIMGQPPKTLPLEACLHHTTGDPNNPEGNSPLIAQWRIERLRYGYEMTMGVGAEHAAGHFMARKTEKGTLSDGDKTNVKAAARAIMTAQEGNYALLPYGIEGEVKDIGFQAAGHLLDIIKYYDITSLAIFFMQSIALNTLTNTGALSSRVDSSNMSVLTFNSALDGLAQQWNDDVEKDLFEKNKASFPNITKRPKVKFSHIENNIDLGALGSFMSTIKDIVPMGEDDILAFRKRAGWMPENSPKPEDTIDSNGVSIEGIAGKINPADTAMNGAQVSSLVDVITKVSTGELPVQAAILVISSAFPKLSIDTIKTMVNSALKIDLPAPNDTKTDSTASQTKAAIEQSLKFVSRARRK